MQSAAKMKLFRRFMRTNAPTALRQVWTDVRVQLGLMAVSSLAGRRMETSVDHDDLFAMPWREFDPALPKATRAMLGHFFDNFATLFSGECESPVCVSGARSSVPFKISRQTAGAGLCECSRRLFDEDTGNAVSDVLVVPRLTSGNPTADHVLLFCSATPLGSDESRFLNTASGLYFAQRTIWESGRREEPIAALRPREIECIRWAITGKTLVEIAEIMGLSYRTVRFHLDSARSRYGFSTNQQLFVQAAKDYGLDPDGDRRMPQTDELPSPVQMTGRLQPMWAERRDPRDRRVADRRQVNQTHLPFPDRRSTDDRRTGQERRAVADSPSQSTEQVLTPEEIRALLH